MVNCKAPFTWSESQKNSWGETLRVEWKEEVQIEEKKDSSLDNFSTSHEPDCVFARLS